MGGGHLGFYVAALILAFGLRVVYVLVRRRAHRPLLSGWIFVVAFSLLVLTSFGSHSRRVRQANAAAVRQGVVETADAATPYDRCVGVYLDWWDAGGRKGRAPGWTKARFRTFLGDVCRSALVKGVLHDDGSISSKPLHRIWYEVGSGLG